MEFGKVGFWREGKPGAPREKPLDKAKNQQQTYPFIYLRHEKGAAFGRSHLIKVIIGSTPFPHPPGGRKASALTSAPLFLSFRQNPIHLLYLFYLLYLDKKICSFMSISLIHNIFSKVCSPVHFLIQGNVTLGLMLPFAVNVTPNLLLSRSLPSIRNRRIKLTAKSKHHVEVLQLLKLGNQQIKTKKIILKDKPGMNQCIYF